MGTASAKGLKPGEPRGARLDWSRMNRRQRKAGPDRAGTAGCGKESGSILRAMENRGPQAVLVYRAGPECFK